MLGFICTISLTEMPIEIDPIWKEPFSFQGKAVKRNMTGKKYFLEQYTQTKFLSEKLFFNNGDFILVTEGIIINMQELLVKYEVLSIEDLIYEIMNKPDFFSEFEGNFVGVFFNKKQNTWYSFMNKFATKKLFYFKNDNYLIFSTDLFTLNQTLNQLSIKIDVDIQAAYLLLEIGFMLENLTLFEQIKQLRAGEYIKYSRNEIKTNFYFHLNDIKPTLDSRKKCIATLNEKFEKAVELYFNFDKSKGYNHLSTISGGLDSRMTSLIAYKLGYTNQRLVNFSTQNYADDVISKRIAKKYNLEIQSIPLDHNCLQSIDDVIIVNDGLNVYTNCTHVFSSLSYFPDINSFGLIHTGMIGDAVMGSFITSKNERKPKITDGIYSKRIKFQATKDFISEIIKKYKNEETYKFYNRAFLGANNGFLYLDLLGEAYSPFLDVEFLSYAYSIPLKYKYKENLYIEWIKTLHKDIGSFIWENQGGKPTNNILLRNYYRYKRAIIKRLPINSMWKNNMTPEKYWYNNNKTVKTYVDQYFYNNVEYIPNSKLKLDVMNLYKNNDFDTKARCVTLVGACKLLLKEAID